MSKGLWLGRLFFEHERSFFWLFFDDYFHFLDLCQTFATVSESDGDADDDEEETEGHKDDADDVHDFRQGQDRLERVGNGWRNNGMSLKPQHGKVKV